MLEINISLESLIHWKVFETPYHGLNCGLAQNVGMIFTILLNASIFCVIREKITTGKRPMWLLLQFICRQLCGWLEAVVCPTVLIFPNQQNSWVTLASSVGTPQCGADVGN